MEDPRLFETIYTARTLRRFRTDPVEDEALFGVLDAAIRAPSGQNAQDWRFVVLREDRETKALLQARAEEAWQRYQPEYAEHPERMDDLPRPQRLSLRSVEHLAHHLAEVPVLILVCGLRGRHGTPGGSAFPAVENLLLAARGLGLAGSIFNLPLTRRGELMERLGIPESNEIHCLIALGYPSDRHGPVRRKPVGKVVFAERWGEPWPYALEQPEDGWTDWWVRGR